MKWRVTYDVWPYSGMKVKEREVSFEFEADRIDDALKIANLVKNGVLTDDRVWQCIVRELVGTHP